MMLAEDLCRQFTTNIWEIIYVIIVQKFAGGSWVDTYDIFEIRSFETSEEDQDIFGI